MAARSDGLSRPKQVAEVITKGVSERVQVRDCVGHQGGHAQNVRECGAVWVQICTRTRKFSGDTFGCGHHLCRIGPRSPSGPIRHGLHGGAGGRVRARPRGDVPPGFSVHRLWRALVCGEEAARTGGCTSSQHAQSAPEGARGWDTVRHDGSRRARGACRCSAASGGRGASACKSGMRRSAGCGGVAAMGAGATLLARA